MEHSYVIFVFPSSKYLALSLRRDQGTYSLSKALDGAWSEGPRKSW